MTTDDLISAILTWLILGQAPVHGSGAFKGHWDLSNRFEGQSHATTAAVTLSSEIISTLLHKTVRPSNTQSTSIGSTLQLSAAAMPMRLFSGPVNRSGNTEPWTKLQFQIRGHSLTISNPTECEVRISPVLVLIPSGRVILLPRHSLRSGDFVHVPNATAGVWTESVSIEPETKKGLPHARYRFPVKHVDASD